MLELLRNPATWVGPAVLAVLWGLEAVVPFYDKFRGAWRRRLRHDVRNLALGLTNKLIIIVLYAYLFAVAESWADEHGVGLLRLVAWPVAIEAAVAFLLLDLWMYAWHRLNHVVPFLWRFHRVHHGDPAMDATTAVRFHTGEIVMSAILRVGVFTLIGASLWHLILYEAVLLPVILFHHSDVRLPRWLDFGLLAVIVTPAMHRVHHSRWRPQTNSNYGSVFPWWDALFRSLRLRRDAHVIELGLHHFDDERRQSFVGMLRTPLERVDRAD